jgi:hypothetical protein
VISFFFRFSFQHLTALLVWHLMAGMNANLVTDAKFALVVAERGKEKAGISVQANWQDFLSNVKGKCYPPEGNTTIHENVWLIPLATGLPFLAELIDWGKSYSVAIRILFLAEAPTWIKYPPDAEAKPSQPTS